MRISLIFFLTLFVWIFFACEFTPSGINPVEIEKVDSVYIELKISDYKDTIPIVKHTILDFDLDINNLALYGMQILIDDQKVNNNGEKRIYLHPESLGQGFHRLKFQVLTNSGSGSLADVHHLEAIYSEFNYILNVDIAPPYALKIISFSNEDGMHKISWERYNRINFSNYILYKYMPKFDHPLVVFTGEDQNITECYDNSYVGGECQYAVGVVSYQGLLTIGEKAKANDIYSQFTNFQKVQYHDSLARYEYELSWSKTEYYRGFKKYEISCPNIEGYMNIEVFDVNTTKISLFDVPFGRSIIYQIGTVPQTLPGITTDTLKCFVGEKTFECDNAIFNPYNGNKYYATHQGLIISKSDGAIERFSNISTIDGMKVTSDKVFITKSNAIDIYDNDNLNKIDEIQSTVFGEGRNFNSIYSISDHGLFIVSLLKGGTADSVYVFNNSSKTLLGSFKGKMNPWNSYIVTSDGNHLLINNILYEIESNELVEKKTFELNNKSHPGFVGNQELYIVDYGSNPYTITYYSLNTLEKTEESLLSSTSIFFKKIPFSDIILVFEDISFSSLYEINLFDLNQRKLIAQIKGFPDDYFLLSDSLISNNGYKMKVFGL